MRAKCGRLPPANVARSQLASSQANKKGDPLGPPVISDTYAET